MTDHDSHGHSSAGSAPAHSDSGHAGHGDGGHSHGGHGPPGIGKYIVVFLLLCGLTAISFLVGNSPLKNKTPEVTWALMMAVSCAKALLVILFFMHLKWEANWKFVLTIPASIMSIFLLLMLVPDVGLRWRHYSNERLLHAAEPYSAAGEHVPEPEPEKKPAEPSKGAPAHKPAKGLDPAPASSK